MGQSAAAYAGRAVHRRAHESRAPSSPSFLASKVDRLEGSAGMLVIGIDPGTATTGYGLIRQPENGELELVDYGVVETPADSPMPDRLMQLHSALINLLSLHRPASGAVEKLFFQRNVSTAISVGQARGVALLALAQAGVPVGEYSPREVKRAVASYGDADKRQMQEMVRILLGMAAVPHPDDAADALAVAICHVHSQGISRRLNTMKGGP